ncbi:hypothetical protein NST63_08490 [Heyndrickxia sp. FSL W8-0496]|uniref:hypothetical protein n=1 Tax=Heyndrickxia TaxID=2837504 RepID=UPI0030FC7A82
MFKWVTKKDLGYWFAFTFVIWLLSSDYGKNNQPLLDNWAFASTVVSIILAVLAIVYSYYQGFTTMFSTKKLEESAEKIVEVSAKLEDNSINVLFENLEKKIESINHTLDEKVDSRFSGFEELISRKIGNDNSNDIEVVLSKEQWMDKIKIASSKTTPFFTLILLYLYLSYKNDKAIVVKDITNAITEKITIDANLLEDLHLSYKNMISGFYMALKMIGVFAATNELYEFKISHMQREFCEAMDEKIEAHKDEESYLSVLSFFEDNN